MGKVIKVESVNISAKKGIIKSPVNEIKLTDSGIVGDAHRGQWHRQVSMLGMESISKFSKEASRRINFGEFAENITSSGMEVFKAGVFDRFKNDRIELEVTQIGKKCHGSNCSIFKEVGNCVMPKEGIFLRVKKGGELFSGDQLNYNPKFFKIKVITVSDRASTGIYEDRSGPKVAQLTEDYFKENNRKSIIEREIVPDSPYQIEKSAKEAIRLNFDIIFTTGGTGIGPRDYTPEVVKSILEKEIPGIMEMIRIKYGMDKSNALLSRSVAGTIGKTLIYTLPGSLKAVEEYLEEIFKTVNHSMLMLHGIGDH